MIVTETKALKWIQNDEIVKIVPALAYLREEFNLLFSEAKKKKKCSSCDLSDPEFKSIRRKVTEGISNLTKVKQKGLRSTL